MGFAWYEYVAIGGFLISGIWGAICEYKQKGQGITRQSNRPEPWDKRLEDR